MVPTMALHMMQYYPKHKMCMKAILNDLLVLIASVACWLNSLIVALPYPRDLHHPPPHLCPLNVREKLVLKSVSAYLDQF